MGSIADRTSLSLAQDLREAVQTFAFEKIFCFANALEAKLKQKQSQKETVSKLASEIFQEIEKLLSSFNPTSKLSTSSVSTTKILKNLEELLKLLNSSASPTSVSPSITPPPAKVTPPAKTTTAIGTKHEDGVVILSELRRQFHFLDVFIPLFGINQDTLIMSVWALLHRQISGELPKILKRISESTQKNIMLTQWKQILVQSGNDVSLGFESSDLPTSYSETGQRYKSKLTSLIKAENLDEAFTEMQKCTEQAGVEEGIAVVRDVCSTVLPTPFKHQATDLCFAMLSQEFTSAKEYIQSASEEWVMEFMEIIIHEVDVFPALIQTIKNESLRKGLQEMHNKLLLDIKDQFNKEDSMDGKDIALKILLDGKPMEL